MLRPHNIINGLHAWVNDPERSNSEHKYVLVIGPMILNATNFVHRKDKALLRLISERDYDGSFMSVKVFGHDARYDPNERTWRLEPKDVHDEAQV